MCNRRIMKTIKMPIGKQQVYVIILFVAVMAAGVGVKYLPFSAAGGGITTDMNTTLIIMAIFVVIAGGVYMLVKRQGQIEEEHEKKIS